MRFAIPRVARHRRKFVSVYESNHLRGLACEDRFFRIVAAMRWPPWFYHAEKASFELDRSGVDAVIALDCGRIYLNIKASFRRALAHAAEEDRKLIPSFAVCADESDESIAERILAVVNREREKIISRQLVAAE